MLELCNVTKTYRSKAHTVYALDGVSLRFPSHGMIFVLGKSGCGKTTLLNILGGLDRPDRGEVLINGRSMRDFSAAELDAYRNTCVGFVFQEAYMLDGFSVRENLRLASELQGKSVTDEEIETALQAVGLEGMAARYPNELSGGQRQRLAIARALIKDPDIILADEPTGALDSQTGEQILALLKELSRRKTVIVVTHNEKQAERYGERLIRMSDGRVVEESGEPIPKKKAQACKLIKSHLRAKSAVRLGLSALLHKKLQLLATLLLCTVAFSFFGVVATMSTYDRERVILRSVQDARLSYVALSPYATVTQYKGEESRYTQEISLGASDGMLGALSREAGVTFYPVFSGGVHSTSYGGEGSDFVFSVENMKKSKESIAAFDGLVYGFSSLDAKAVEEMGFELKGRMPAQSGEIVITEFLYRQFKTYGFCNTRFEECVDAADLNCESEDPHSILGKHFTVYTGKNKAYNLSGNERELPKYDYEIVGVLDTGFDYERYASFLPGGDTDAGIVDRFLLDELTEALCSSPHALCYLNVQDILMMAQDVKISQYAWGTTEADLSVGGFMLAASLDTGLNTLYLSSFYTEQRMSQMDIVWLDGKERSALAENEILLNSKQLSCQVELDYAPVTNAILALVGKEAWEATKVTDTYYLRVQEAAISAFVADGDGIAAYREALVAKYGALSDTALCDIWKQALLANPAVAPFSASPCANEILRGIFDALIPVLCEFLCLPVDGALCDTEREAVLYVLTTMRDVEIVNKKDGTGTGVLPDATQEDRHLHGVYWLQEIYLRFFAAREAAQLRLWENEAFLRYFHTVSGDDAKKWQTMDEAARRESVTQAYLTYVKGYAAQGNVYGTLRVCEMQLRAFDHLYRIAGYEGNNPYLEELSLRVIDMGAGDSSDAFVAELQGLRLRIVGIFDGEKYTGSAVSDALLAACRAEIARSGETYTEISAKQGGYWSYALAPMPADEEKIEELLCLELGMEGIRFRMTNEIVSVVDAFGNDVRDVAFYLGFVALGFLLFAGVLMATLIGSSVAFRKKEIGLLRSLGARALDVHRIFAAKALVISLACAVPASLIGAVCAVWINRAAHEAGVRLSILYFGPFSVLALLTTAILSALISSFFPIFLMNRRTPAALLFEP